nr:MFS transporter [uncultured Carboxylicivirga sp.]
MKESSLGYSKDGQFYKFCAYGFFKNLRFFDPFLLLFFIEKGITYTQVGILYGIREISINILEVPSGMIADIVGRKRAMIFAFLSYIISFLMFYILEGFIGFAIAFFFYGIGDAFRSGTHKSMILAYLKRKGWENDQTAYYGQTRSWSQRGAALASLLSAVMVFYTGSYKYVFLVSIVPYVIDLVLMMSYPSFLNGDQELDKTNVWQLFKNHFLSMKEAFSGWKPFRILTITSSYTGYYKAIKDYIQPILVTLAVSLPFLTTVPDKKKAALFVGIFYTILYLINAFFSRNAYKVEEWFKGALAGLLIIQLSGWVGGAIAGIMYVQNLELISILFFSIILIIQNVRRPIAVKYISKNFDDKIMSTVLSAESQSETIFTSIFAVVLGVLVDNIGFGYGLLVISVVLILFNVFMLFIRKRH